MNVTLEAEVRPFTPKQVKAGAPHLAAHDSAFIHAVQSLWWKCAGTRRSWVWPDPDSAPWISTASLSTYTYFSMGNASVSADLELPWVYQKGVDGMTLVLGICFTDQFSRESARATLSGLDSAVTEKSCASVVLSHNNAPPPGLWARRTNRWMLSTALLRFNGITSDNMTASRYGTIKPSLSFDFRTAPDNLNIVRRARLYSIFAMETFAAPSLEP